MINNAKKLYFCVMENTFANNIHASQVYPIIKRTPNMRGLFLNPSFEISRSRIGPIYFDQKFDSNIQISRLPLATYFFFSSWFMFPIRPLEKENKWGFMFFSFYYYSPLLLFYYTESIKRNLNNRIFDEFT